VRVDDFIQAGAGVAFILKDPQAVLDYVVKWSDWLADAAGDTIVTASWTVPVGITKLSESNTAIAATIWLSGGTAGTTYRITNQITTAAGRIAQRSFDVVMQEL